LFLLLQHGDTFFPSGAVSFSWGLEGAFNEGWVTSKRDLAEFLESQLRNRWATTDRAFIETSHVHAADLDAVAELDAILEAMTLPEEQRTGSHRAGGALLLTHEKLATPGSAEYRRRQRSGAVPGHLAVVHGMLCSGLGLSREEATVLSAYTNCSGLLGAAVRLGLVGHVESQRILARAAPLIAELTSSPAPGVTEATSFTPVHDLASICHESQHQRLFSN
jgi:urease accessory protein